MREFFGSFLTLIQFLAVAAPFSTLCLAQLPELSPTELANRHEAMFRLIQTAEIVTDLANGADSKIRETSYFWMDGDERRFVTEPIDRAKAIQECYFDGTTLFQIQRSNADVVIPQKLKSVDSSPGLGGMIRSGAELERLDSTLWSAMLRFRLTWGDVDWSLPQLVEVSNPAATSELVVDQRKPLYKVTCFHPGVHVVSMGETEGKGGKLSIYLDPGRNYAAVRVESEIQSIHEGVTQTRHTVLSTSGDWMHSQGVWIPTKTEWKVIIEGKQPTNFRSHQIELVQVNHPLDPKIMHWQFPENMLVCEVDKAGVTHDMHLVDGKGAFKETFKNNEEYDAWRIRSLFGLPRKITWISLSPHFLACFGLLALGIFIWRTVMGKRDE